MNAKDATNCHEQWRTFGRKQNVENKTYTRGQDKQDRIGKIGGMVARMLATVAHVNSLIERMNKWSLSVHKPINKHKSTARRIIYIENKTLF